LINKIESPKLDYTGDNKLPELNDDVRLIKVRLKGLEHCV